MNTNYMKLIGVLLALSTNAVIGQSDEAALAALVTAHEVSAPAPLFDRNAFEQKATVPTALLAPDGRHVAWLSTEGLQSSLHLLDTATLQSTRLFGSRKLRGIEWAADGELILDLGDAVGGLTPIEPAAPSFFARLDPARGDYLLGASRAAAGGVLVVRKPEPATYVLELVADSGAATQLFTTDEKIEHAFLSRDGTQVFLETTGARERHISVLRITEPATLLTCPILAACRLVSHDADTNTLWLLTSHDSNLLGLQAMAVADSALRPVHSDPAGLVDVEAVTTIDARPAFVRYHPGTARHYSLDAGGDVHLERLQALLAQGNLTLSSSADGGTWLVTEDSATLRESRRYLYDTTSMQLREILVDARDDTALPREQLSAKIPIQYQARDGQTVHGYVSLPKGMPMREVPLVALPHGGPWAHVTSAYSGFTQFLVNRGYIVLEPNFRASTGYGRAWMEAANRAFGDSAVQYDIVDGVQYLLSQGIGNPEKIGIVGYSFGGFSVLAGLAFTPELFKVGVAAVPPAAMGSSLRQQMDTQLEPGAAEQLRLLLADVDDPADMQRLYDMSPQARLDAIEAPLLIAAGADDDRVAIAHVKDYTLEMVNLGKTLSLFVDENEGHGLDAPRTRRAFYYLTEKMFGLYLGGRTQPLEDPALAGYIQRKLLLNTNPEFSIE